MKRAGLLLVLLLDFLGGILWFLTRPAKVSADQLPPHTTDLPNGRTRFNAGGCPSCHAPNPQERSRMERALGLWKLLFLPGGPVASDVSRSEAWNRGAYLVNGPAHCAECHSPRNALGAIVSSHRFAGGPDPEGSGGSIPNVTQAGIGD